MYLNSFIPETNIVTSSSVAGQRQRNKQKKQQQFLGNSFVNAGAVARQRTHEAMQELFGSDDLSAFRAEALIEEQLRLRV
jgi:hypothetical protein